jgi:S1-C subfamily serine protease
MNSQSNFDNNANKNASTIQVHPINKNSFSISLIFKILAVIFLILSILILSVAGYLAFNPQATSQLLFPWLNNSDRTANKNDSTSNNSGNNASNTVTISGPFQFTSETGAKSASQVIEESLDSVLSVRVTSSNGKQALGSESAGTGYFATEDGLVLTNRHVISQACRSNVFNQTIITGLTYNQKAVQLELLSVDPIDDIAILRVKNPQEKFKAVKFADSNKLKLGSEVIAVGNVLGELTHSVTKGIVSGLNRSLDSALTDPCTNKKITADGLIQSDAAINKGNSGGPLFDASGSVVGMNTFATSEAQNIAFSIPSSTIVSVLNTYQKNNKITRPRLGVSTRPIDPALKLENTWLPLEYGELVFSTQGQAVTPGSSAEKIGLKDGDIILEVDGQKLVSNNINSSPLRRQILNRQPDSEIELTILRALPPQANLEGFRYYQNSEKVKVKLGSVSFDLNSNI